MEVARADAKIMAAVGLGLRNSTVHLGTRKVIFNKNWKFVIFMF
jgi:hypothetical protein